MTDFAIEDIGGGDRDLVLAMTDHGDLDFVIVGATEATWIDEIAQRILYAVGTWFSESAWDRSIGFPWIEGVFGRQPLDGISVLVQQRITAVDGVDGLIGEPILSLDPVARVLRIEAVAQCGVFQIPIDAKLRAPA